MLTRKAERIVGKNAKKLRRQDWESEIEADLDESPRNRKRAIVESESVDPQFPKAAPSYRSGPGKHNFIEGQVVLIEGKTGATVVDVLGDVLCCLESNGLIHYVRHYHLVKSN